MNICFFSKEYPPETHAGGIGTYTHNVAMNLTKLGHTVHVITSTRGSDRTTQDSGVWVHRLKNRRLIPRELWHLNYSYSVARKVSEIDCRFDIVQSCEFASEAFWFALTKKLPLVTRLATPFFLAEKLDGRWPFGPRVLLDWMEKRQTVRSDGIFTSTRALAKAVTQKWGIETSRVEIIPNSVDIARIVEFGRNKAATDMLAGKSFLLYFGRLEERKGLRILARALPPVFDRFPDLSMVFIGTDLKHRGLSMRAHINRECRQYRERLIFFDNLPQEKLFPIVKLAKLVVLPSLWEGFGFVCVEAMALGRPIIATSGSGFEESIEDNVSGYLVDPGNSHVLGERIIDSLRDEEGLRRISEGARRRAREFEVSKVSSQLLDYYEKISGEWLAGRA
jgi:glycosyltransferase involved in cell wall biosynthesis